MKRNELFPVAIFSLGVLCTFFFAWGVYQVEVSSSQKQFIKEASSYAMAMEIGLAARFHELNAVHGLFEASELVESHEFDAFVGRILSKSNQYSAIQWFPRRPSAEYPPPSDPERPPLRFKIPAATPANGQGDIQDLVYFSIEYSFPHLDQLYPMASDDISVKEIETAMLHAAQDGQPRVLVHRHSDKDATHPHDLDIWLPVYEEVPNNRQEPNQRRNLRGFLRSRSELWFAMESLIDTLFAHPGGIDIDLFGTIDGGQRGVVYHHESRLRPGNRPPSVVTEANLQAGFHFANDIQVGNQRWHLIMSPVDLTAYADHQKWYPWAVLALGCLTTLLLTFYAQTLLANTRRIQTLVEERTAALQESQARFASLQASEQRYRSVTESAQDGIVTIDENSCVLTWNRGAETIFGYLEQEIIGQSLLVLIPESQRRPHAAKLLETTQSVPAQPFYLRGEKTGLRKDGSKIPLEITGASWSSGGQTCFTGIIRDVSGWKQLLNELKQARETETRANQAKSIFLATMSHEIRTPMNGILGMAELLSLSPLADEQRDQLRVIMDAGKNLIAIINDILDFSKIEAGKLALESVDFDLGRQLDSLSSLYGNLAQARHLSLTTRISPATPRYVRGDPHRLNQILTNLLGNAIKFTEAGGVTLGVDLDSRSGEHWLELTIQDTGPGIPPDQVAMLFQPFTQADSSTTRRFGGTGLGLSITQKLVELMRGTIQVTSRPGQGSTFRVTLPILLASGQVEEARPSAAPPSPAIRNARILLVEDDRINQAVLGGMFRQLGVQITLATNGQEALRQLEEHPWDLVFMDCHMPVMDGFTACRTWREREEAAGVGSALPVIALTALASPDDQATCLQAGMSDFIAKPTTLKQLAGAISRWLPATFAGA